MWTCILDYILTGMIREALRGTCDFPWGVCLCLGTDLPSPGAFTNLIGLGGHSFLSGT